LLNEIQRNPEGPVMNEVLAHVTQYDVPGYWLAALAGFMAGVAVTFAMLARKAR
jgi:glycerol uptake facilitator-like aquaporin